MYLVYQTTRLLDYNRSDPLQYGFCKLSSCKTELIEFIDDFFKNLENGKHRHFDNGLFFSHLIRLSIL